jgi:aminoglycoside 3-N-acetyltransferase
MSESDAIAGAGERPITTASLVADLGALGVSSGSVLLVHSSLSSLGWVCGGGVAVVDALLSAVGELGTLVVPTHSGDLSEPSVWQNPPVPEEWWPVIRETMPAFDPDRTPTRGMGHIPEALRSLPGAIRSNHPTASFAAYGPKATQLCLVQDLEDAFGDRSPLGVLHASDADILLLGVGYSSCTSLHFAERRAFGLRQATVRTGSPIVVDGQRRWVSYSEPYGHSGDFDALGLAFERDLKKVRIGRVGVAEAKLISQRVLVDYAVEWFQRHRLSDGRPRS